MPHQCVRCGNMYENGAEELLKGCTCGGKFFFFIKNVKYAKDLSVELTKDDRKQIEEDVKEIIGDEIDDSQPVVLELENIRIMKPGQYELDLVGLFSKKPLIYKLEDGKYMIDIISSFNNKKE